MEEKGDGFQDSNTRSDLTWLMEVCYSQHANRSKVSTPRHSDDGKATKSDSCWHLDKLAHR